jgi:NAD(P)-dependent dehydrogenase (short-subunit alcohol dehydrogenase family)
MAADAPLGGKIAIVTGGSRGLGRKMARALRDAGASVAIFARPSPDLDDAVAELGGGAILGCPCDVTDASQVRDSVAATIERFGGLDILVNNAGMAVPVPVVETSDEQLRRQIDTNLLAPILCARAAIPHLRVRGGGDIVNVSSETVRFGFPFLSIYAATKAGLESFSSGLRSELSEYKIRVTVLRMGNSSTDSTFGRHWSPQMIERFFAIMQKTGFSALSGPSMTATPATQALLAVLTMPRESNVDLIEVRSI